MIKLVYSVRRRPEMSHEDFSRYWLEQHGPLVRSLAGVLGTSKYIQSHTTAPDINQMMTEMRGLAEPFDGITELWWESAERLTEALSSPEGQEASARLAEDEAKFIDFAGSSVFLTEEHVIFDL